MPTTVTRIQDRILSTIDHLFDAFDSGSFEVVTAHWAQVGGEIKTSSPNSNTHVAAFCIEELCNAFTSFTQLSANLEQHLSECLSRPSEDDTDRPPNPPTANQPPYIKPASEWLLGNLHNPFPPAKFREHLSAAHGYPRKNIDTWFNEARKRIGWNTIRKRCFGSRKEMVDAASSFFLDHVTSGEFDNEFLRMAEKAKDLYPKRLVKSELMQKLDRRVKPMSDEVKRQADEENRERQLEKRRVSYRSDEKAAPPPTLVARKKRRSHHDDEDDQPSRKRLRSHSGCDDDDDDDNSSSSGSSSRRASSLFSEAPSESSSATEASSPSSASGSADSSREHRLKCPRISSAPTTPMNLHKSPAENRLTQTQTQLSSDVPSESSKSISATEVPSPSVTSGKRRSSDSSHERRRKRPRISSAPTPMTVPTFPAEEDWFTLTQAQTQLPTDVECSCDISSWLASMDSLSDADSSCVTTPTHLLHNNPLPHIDQGNSLLELDNSIAADSPLLPTNTTDLSDLCQMTFPEYYYTLSDPFGFDFPEFDISSTLASPYPVYHAGVVA